VSFAQPGNEYVQRKEAVNAIEVRNLAKNYPLGGSQWSRFRHVFKGSQLPPDEGIWALRDISFDVARGEAFGIVGPNGSGKSTLLQIIAGILKPTSGSVEVKGRLSALLELGSGFSPEFTGRENVYLNASILGFSREETDARLETIERFASIGDFIDQPVKTYSSGMVLRLAFAVVAHADPEVLIVDEALAVGDIAFRQRCMRRIHDLRARGTTLLFVSHETTDIKAFCDRCLWLQKGAMQQIGESDAVVSSYLTSSLKRQLASDRDEHAASASLGPPSAGVFMSLEPGKRSGDGRAVILGADLTEHDGASIRTLVPDTRVTLRVSFRVNAPVASLIAGFLVRNLKGEFIVGTNTARENYPVPSIAAGSVQTIEFHWTVPPLAPGAYTISLGLADGDMEQFEFCDYAEDALAIGIAGGGPMRGYLRLRCTAVAVHR
jgi:lipopolysaccharide transport system ATP-binding protein